MQPESTGSVSAPLGSTSKFEYDMNEFKLVEKYNQEKQAEKLAELVAELNRKGSEGWEMIGLHTFEVVGGVLGGSKGNVSFTMWKRELPA